MTTAAAAARRVCFLTDIEGNWRYVRNVVRQSTCLRFTPRTPQNDTAQATRDECGDLDLCDDDCFLVFGGDAGDKGGETLQCYEQLVRLKKKYPDRVVLLVGNRDVNKMRLTSELDDSEMDLRTMAKSIREGPAWVPTNKRVTLDAFLASKASTPTTTNNSCDTNDMPTDELEAVNTKVNRLQWMLEHTMGAQGDFERRRSELAARTCCAVESIDDATVLQSYIDSVKSGGVVREFLELAQLAFVAHTTLFVHGGILNRDGASALGVVPDDSSATRPIASVHAWVDALNAWYDRQVQAWINEPVWSRDHRTRGGNVLLQYVLPDATASVVMGRHLLDSGMPMQVPAHVAELLSASQIERIVVGHTPHGNCPTVIKQSGGSKVTFDEVVMCDTSYSCMAADDNRGNAAADVVLEPGGCVSVHGILDDGRAIAYSTDDVLIGRTLRDGTYVKAKLVGRGDAHQTDPEYVVCSVANGFEFTYATRTRSAIEAIGVLAGSDE